MGLPFFLLGGALNGIKKCLKEKKSYQWVFLTASALLFLLEIYVVASKAIYSNLVLTFMLYPLVASIMVLLLCNPIEKADKIGGFSRACANITYYSHPAVILLVEVLFKLQSPTLLFLLVTVISVGLGWLYKKLGIQEKILKLFNLGVKS